MKALVIGGAGFVGRHLISKLLQAGYFVVNVDPKCGRNTISNTLFAYNETFEQWYRQVRYTDTPFDLVVHLGATIPDINNRLLGGLHQYADIKLDLAVAEFALRTRPKIFVWPTSCAVDNPKDPYAWVKLTGERIFGEVHKAGIRTVMLRPFSGYGADQALTYPFPAILKRVMDGEDPIKVWGSGTQVRDFVHIDDLTDAFMHGINWFPSGVPIEIGTGHGTSMLDLAKLMTLAYPQSSRRNIVPMTDMPASSDYRVADIKKAQSLGWTAKISLEEGIKRAIDEIEKRERGV